MAPAPAAAPLLAPLGGPPARGDSQRGGDGTGHAAGGPQLWHPVVFVSPRGMFSPKEKCVEVLCADSVAGADIRVQCGPFWEGQDSQMSRNTRGLQFVIQ